MNLPPFKLLPVNQPEASLNRRHASQPIPSERPIFGTIVHAETGWPIDLDRGVLFARDEIVEVQIDGGTFFAVVCGKERDAALPIVWLLVTPIGGRDVRRADPARVQWKPPGEVKEG